MEILHETGPAVSSWTFDEPPDKVSLDALPADPTGLVFCRARTYAFDPNTDMSQPSGVPPPPSIARFDPVNRIFTVDANDPTFWGSYTADITIKLLEYEGFPGEKHQIVFLIIPACSLTVFTPAPITDMTVAVFDAPLVQSFPAWGYSTKGEYFDYCSKEGKLTYTLVGGDTAYLKFDPIFLTLIVQTQDTLLAGTYPHTIRAALDQTDYTVFEDFTF